MILNHTWNQHVVKRGNKSIVLQVIKDNTPISRADIAKMTGLNKSTVSSLVSELLLEELIYESGPGESSGGRRPVMLLFNELAGFSIGIDLGVNYMLGILTDLNGNIVKEEKLNFYDLTYKKIESQLIAMIKSLSMNTPSCKYGVIGIGIGVPGIVNKDGEILLAPNLGWKNIRLKTIIEDEFAIPVIIENEANAGAYGEKKFGVGQAFDNIVYVSAGIGIGVGLLLNGKLYQGHEGFSGEMGHMTIDVNGLECRCGNKGCWELYASENTLLKKAKELKLNPHKGKELCLDALIKLANTDQRSADLFEEIGTYLGIGINNIINIFNPEQVIIGNRLASAKKWIKKPINKHIKDHTQRFQQKGLRIDFSEHSTHSSALGVVAFTVENFLQIDLVN
ncbi:ROK family protein [Guptibacillus hwajinpoensis]|uniref:ROK family protein n=1 Tax=Guptibacillus hwajinpoensis TaxID=208199 RepID=UPI001CFF2ED7|nr:ROK family protein [Pseudalkalibacillus hwajinpoensis]WLR61753.1 ROK family protein [Pseudalkalibacillus hwajinpoensis]